MTPKKQAEELIDKYRKAVNVTNWNFKHDPDTLPKIKKCALIAVDLLLNDTNITGKEKDFWENVKKQIELL